MGVYMSASASVDLVGGVGGCAEPHGNSAGDGTDHAEELACVAFVVPVECTHVPRVTAADVSAMICDVWSGLPARDREVWPAVIVVGCLFFLILGAVLR